MATSVVDRGPKGVAVQMHVYIGLPPSNPDNSTLWVKDDKQIEIVSGSTDETLRLQVDHVYQQAPERDVLERSLRPLVSPCVEGVNVSVLAFGSAKAQKHRVLFSPMPDLSLAVTVFQALLDTLQNKVFALNDSTNAFVAMAVRKSQVVSSATFSLRLSFVEFFEETITDLLADTRNGNRENSRQDLLIDGDPDLGKIIQNLTQSAPLTSAGDFRKLLDVGLSARHNANGLYGNSSEFSSAVLRISVKQTFTFSEAPTQELHSFFDLVDLPATDRLTRSGSAIRLSEGPLLNKSLFALQEVVENLSSANMDEVPVRYEGSQLTTLLQDALGGNCLTFALMCLSHGDMNGSAATFQLGKMLPRVRTFPVVNNDMLRGLRRRQCMVQKQHSAVSAVGTANESTRDTTQDYERKLHELEGELAQRGLERRLLREDKDALAAQLGDLRNKYRELFDNEISLRTELLSSEQEKLVLSKALIAFQQERDTQVQQLDNDKFEAETRLLKAEQLVVEIQQDDTTKATQIQDLCAKMNELVADKTRLGGELELLQKAARTAESAREAEAKKNQQLSLELIVAVNQKQKFQGEMETLAAQLRTRQAQADTQQTEYTQLRSDNEALRLRATEFEAKMEVMRKDVVRRELELERAELAVKKEQLQTQQAGRDADSKRELTVKQLNDELGSQRLTFTTDKRSLELQLERLQHDLANETRKNQQIAAALKVKSEENEELQLTLERARHDLQTQLENFRLKLALLHQSGKTEHNTSEAGVGIQALRELLASYQVHEKELHDELESARNVNLRLLRRVREFDQTDTNPLRDKDQHPDSEEPREAAEINQLRGRLEAAEQQLASEMHKRSEQALRLAELETQHANLLNDHKEKLQTAPLQDNDNAARVISEMQAALTRQLEEMRRLTLQQQSNQQATHAIDNVAPTSQPSTNANNDELETLRAAKTQLESRLSSTKAHWMTVLEQVERRCAELLTKNVMLTEDNENLRKYLTKALLKARN